MDKTLGHDYSLLEDKSLIYYLQNELVPALVIPFGWTNISFLFLGIVSVMATIYYAMTNWTRTARLLNKFPGPTQIPFLGNFALVFGPYEDLQGRIHSALSEYGGSVMRFWVGHKPFLVVADGKIVEKVLYGHDNLEKSDNYGAFHRLLNQSLVTAPVPKWKRDRKILMPALNFQCYDEFMQVFNEQSKILSEILAETFSESSSRHTDLLPFFKRATLGSVYESVLGSKQDAQRNPKFEYVEKFQRIMDITRLKLLSPYLDFPIIWRLFGHQSEEEKLLADVMNYFKTMIDTKFKEREETGKVVGKPFISYLMDVSYDQEDIAYQVMAFMMGGIEPPSACLNYMLFLLALNPSVQDKVLEEIDAVFPDGIDKVTLANLAELKYLECCLKETLRLYPTVPGWFRRVVKDVKLDDGNVIPRGAQLAFLPYEIHRNPKIFPDPESFNPDRFNSENIDKIPPGWWVPFSYGPRNCIGYRYGLMEMKTMLAHILKTFTIHTQSKRENVRVVYGISLEATPEIRLYLKQRDF